MVIPVSMAEMVGKTLDTARALSTSWRCGAVVMTAAILLCVPSSLFAESGATSHRVPCWGDLTQGSASIGALPLFARSIRASTCDPVILKAAQDAKRKPRRGHLHSIWSRTRATADAVRGNELQAAQDSVRLAAKRPATEQKQDYSWYVKMRRGIEPPPGTDHVIVTNSRGNRIASGKSLRMINYVTKEDETIRSVAYRVASSPDILAHANGLQWAPEGVPLPPNLRLKVPLRFRPASGFSNAVRLTSGPGVHAVRVRTAWGRPYTVRLLRDAFAALHRLWPNRHPLVVHDLSKLGGGRLWPHKSHRAGRDVDLGYPTLEANRKHWGWPTLSEIDYERLWFFIDRLEQSGQISAVYMHPSIQRRLYTFALVQAGAEPTRLKSMFQYPAAGGAKRTLIRHSPGHRDHLHIRFQSKDDLVEIVRQS